MARFDVVPLSATLLERFAKLGVDVDALLVAAGIVERSAPIRVTTKQFFAVWTALDSKRTPRDLGLRLGAESLPNAINVASLAAIRAPTFGEALARYARYKRITCPEEIAVSVVRGEARVTFEWLLAEEDPPSFLIDGILAGVLSLGRTGTGTNLTPRRIELTRRKRDVGLLRDWFGCEITFDAPADLIAFDEAALALPFVTHDPAWSESLLPGLGTIVSSRAKRTVADELRAALGRHLGERPSVDKVAKTLGMSGRTLQRRLGEIGTTYQAVLDDVRRRSARRLLGETDLDSAAVAFLLGFEELNSFTRAFHAWEGTTPLRWRNSP